MAVGWEEGNNNKAIIDGSNIGGSEGSIKVVAYGETAINNELSIKDSKVAENGAAYVSVAGASNEVNNNKATIENSTIGGSVGNIHVVK